MIVVTAHRSQFSDPVCHDDFYVFAQREPIDDGSFAELGIDLTRILKHPLVIDIDVFEAQ